MLAEISKSSRSSFSFGAFVVLKNYISNFYTLTVHYSFFYSVPQKNEPNKYSPGQALQSFALPRTTVRRSIFVPQGKIIGAHPRSKLPGIHTKRNKLF